MIGDSASVFSQYPIAMSVINIRNRLALRCQIHYVLQRCYVAVHAEYSVCDDENSPKVVRVLQLLLQIIHVFVFVDAPRSFRHPTAIYYASMVQLITDYQVPLINQGEDRPGVGGVARLERDRSLRAAIISQNLLQFQVQVHRPSNNSKRT